MLFGEHEFHLGEGYVQLKGSNFSESADSKGECQNQISTSLQSYITPSFCFQLIAVARALLKKASILFLDEVIFDPFCSPCVR